VSTPSAEQGCLGHPSRLPGSDPSLVIEREVGNQALQPSVFVLEGA
jgi:hypothetical protein